MLTQDEGVWDSANGPKLTFHGSSQGFVSSGSEVCISFVDGVVEDKIGVLVKSVEVRCEEGNNNEGEECAMVRKMYGSVLVGHKASLGPGVVRLLTPEAP